MKFTAEKAIQELHEYRELLIEDSSNSVIDTGVLMAKAMELFLKMEKSNGITTNNSGLNTPIISHFIDENGNNVDLKAVGVNVKLLSDGTFKYFISYGFAGRNKLTPVYKLN